MKKVFTLISNNRITLIGIICGLVIGYLYWHYFACYWGTYPLSAECWVNCAYGALAGGFFTCLVKEKMQNKNYEL